MSTFSISRNTAYDEVFAILDEVGVGSNAELHLPRNADGTQGFSTFEFPWAKDLAVAIEKTYRFTTETHSLAGELSLIHDAIEYTKDGPGWVATDPVFDLRSRYACVFPGRILYLTHNAMLEDDGEAWVPADYVILANSLRPLLKAGMAFLLPRRMTEHSGPLKGSKFNAYYHYTDPKKIQIKWGPKNLNELFAQTQKDEFLDPKTARVLQSPFIIGGTLEHMVELAYSNFEDFNRYNSAVSRFARPRPKDVVTLKEWVEELDDRSRHMQEILLKKKKALSRKGFECAAGMAITAVTLAIPDLSEELKTAIAGLLSSKSLYEGRQWYKDWSDLKNQSENRNLWSLWKTPSLEIGGD